MSASTVAARGWLITLALAAAFVSTTLATASSNHAVPDVALLAILYGLLAATLTHGSLHLLGRHPALGAAAALVVGFVLAWHWREQTRAPGTGGTLWSWESLAPFLVWTALAAALFLGLLAWARARSLGNSGRPGKDGRSLLVAVAAGLGFVAVLVPAWHGSAVFRWHLLHHNKLIGTPAYHLLAPPVQELEQEVWRRHRRDSQAPEVDPVPNPPAAGPGTRDARRHVVFVLLDTWRADSLAARGGDGSVMPAIERLADRSAVFTDVIANSSWTRPSMASMFTGLAPETHGAVGWTYALPEPRVTLAELLRDRGYATAAVVSNYQAVGQASGFAQGFESFHELRDTDDAYARAESVTDAALSWLDGDLPDQTIRDGRPAFLWVHYLDPHVPYLSGDEIDPDGATPVSHAEARRQYDAELTYLDGQVGRLLEGVRRRLGSDVTVVLTSDHGEEFGEHDGRGHGHSLYSETVHIPLLIAGAGIEAGRIDAPLEGRDLFDLMLYLADTSGADLYRWAREARRRVRYASVFHTILLNTGSLDAWLRPTRTRLYLRLVEQDGWRLIWSAYGPTWELYDLSTDSRQLDNRYRTHERRAGRLAALLEGIPERWAARLVPVGVGEEDVEDLRALGYAR